MVTEYSRFPDFVTVTELAGIIGVPVQSVLDMMWSHSMPDALPQTVISQGVAERVSRVVLGLAT